MGMSDGDNDGLFKLAEKAAPDENRLMPTERTYLKTSKTVSVEEAVALLKKRKKDPSLRIKGGLDDETASIRKTPIKEATVAQSEKEAPVQIEVVPEIKSQKGRVTTSDIMSAISVINRNVHSLSQAVDKIQNNMSGVGSSVKNTDSLGDVLNEFKAGSHKVSFIYQNMEFTVKCLNQVKDTDAHTIVFVFLDDGDSFFTPPMQSELEVKYDGVREPGKLYYFGMCFSLKALGLKFLGFLYDENSVLK